MKENKMKTVNPSTGKMTKTVTATMIDQLRWEYGVTGICMAPGMSKWQICPDSLHCILNIHVLLWEMVSACIFTSKLESALIPALKSIGLHSIVSSVNFLMKSKKIDQKSLKNLKLKGPVCVLLELFIVRFFKTLTGGMLEYGPLFTSIKGIILAYMKFNQLARVLRSSNPSQEDVHNFSEKALVFSRHVQHVLGASSVAAKSYMHILFECLPRFITFWLDHLGIGPAVWSTSCGESKNVDCYEGEQHHCNMSSGAMIQVMEHDLRTCAYCPKIVGEVRKKDIIKKT